MESINKQDAIDVIKALPRWILNPKGEFQPVDPPTKAMIDPDDAIEAIENLPPAQPEPYIDSIVSEIKKTISETKESGKHHEIRIRTNGEMICFGLQLALEIIEEKRNERSDIQASCN